jgi:hypothetical protein
VPANLSAATFRFTHERAGAGGESDGRPAIKFEQAATGGNSPALFMSGRSAWNTKGDRPTPVDTGSSVFDNSSPDVTGPSCDLGDRVFEHGRIMLAAGVPAQCSFSNDDGCFANWPGISGREDAMDGNYLAVLAFAWAYILSAR